MRGRISLVGMLVLTIGIALPAAAQITVTASDISAALYLGRVSYQYEDTTSQTLDIGTPGATSWDFRYLRMDNASTLTSVAPGSTPFSADFPGATHAFQTAQTMQGITGTVYQYFILGTNLSNPGMKGSGKYGTYDVIYSMTNSPAQLTYALPSTYGTTWNTSYTETELVTVGGFVFSGPTATSFAESYRVDAYGPMMVRGGATYQALRIRYESRSPGLRIGYIFLSKEGAIISAWAQDTLATSGVVGVGSTTWISPVAVGVEAEARIPAEYELRQNYPNPFNPSTVIGYRLPAASNVRLAVYDLLGRELALLVDERKEAGSHEIPFAATGLSSGTYIYRLTAGGAVLAKKMTIVK